MGVKRRVDPKGSAASKTHQPLQQADIKRKVFHAFQLAKKAADKARTFDIQKLVKRLKDARSDKKSKTDVDPQALEAQLQALKDLPNDYIAHVALLSKIRKDKTLAANEDVAAGLSDIQAPAAPTGKSHEDEIVRSRVLSSKHLSSAIQDALASLHSASGTPQTSKAASSSKIKPETETGGSSSDSDEGNNDDDGDVEIEDNDEDEEGMDDQVDDSDVAMEEDVVIDDADEASGADGWESGSVNSDPDDSGPTKETHTHTTTTAPQKGASSSLFLPSLSVGFTRGDSDSDWSDGEAKVADGVRKNRRGQRARQAIWEKKYGRGAKHVQKRQQMEARAAAYANVRRGRGAAATDRATRGRGATRGGRGRGGQTSHNSRTQHAAGSSSVPPAALSVPKPAHVEKPVHPSWEAKQKQKAAAAIVPAQGKKIVFA